MSIADARVCSITRARLRGHLEAYGVGGRIAKGRCKGISWRGGGGGVALLGGRVCEVVVTPCVLRSLETILRLRGTRLLRCMG